jgi:hypothetical protein
MTREKERAWEEGRKETPPPTPEMIAKRRAVQAARRAAKERQS